MKKENMTIMPVHTEESKRADEIKNAAEILVKAEEIRANKQLMEHVKLELKRKKKIITSVAELREKANGQIEEERYEDGEEAADITETEDGEEEVDFPKEAEPAIERKIGNETVLAPVDESEIQIQGPATKMIYTKEKK